MLKNPFYFGEFEYPIKSGVWYQGKHPPLITKPLFDKVQTQLITSPKSPWGEKSTTFKGLFKCGTCKGNMLGEDRFRKRKWSEPRRHIYYHCARKLESCPEPYIDEDKLIKQILRYINFMNIAHPNHLKLTEALQASVLTYQSIREEVLYEQDISPNSRPLDPVTFARYILYNGTTKEKRDLVIALGKQMYIKNKFIGSSPEEIQELSKDI